MNAAKPLDVNDLHKSGALPHDPFVGTVEVVEDPNDVPSAPPEEDVPINYDTFPEAESSTEQTAKEREQVKDNKEALKQALTFAYERIERAANGQTLAGISTGFKELDRVIDGLKQGCLYGMGGRPGMGKSVLALNICLNAAKQGHGAYYVSLEMSTMEHVLRQIFCLSGVPSYRWKNNNVRPEDWSAMTTAASDASKYPIYWDDATGQTIEKIRQRTVDVRDSFAANGKRLDLLIIDHALLIRGSVGKDRRTQLVHITNQLKCLAKELGIAVLALAQLNRSLEARTVKCKKPQMSDFKESGSWEEDSDVMMLLYRQDYYTKDRTKWDNKIDVDVAKVRDGEPGTISLHFDGACHRILPIAKDDEPEGMVD